MDFAKNRGRLLSVIITGVIISLLVFSGPAQAFILGFSIPDPDVNKGEKIYLDAQINVELVDNDLDYVQLFLDGPGPFDVSCKFFEDGTIKEGCMGLNISSVDASGNPGCPGGYDYSYSYACKKKLRYNITLDSSKYIAGKYLSELSIKSGNISLTTAKQTIEIRANPKSLAGCSLRGKAGELVIDEESWGNRNSLSFYVPLKNADKGSGSLTSQFGRKRFSYSFNIKEVLENDANNTVMVILIETGKKNSELNGDALIFFDKQNKKVKVWGNNFVLDDVDVTFTRNC